MGIRMDSEIKIVPAKQEAPALNQKVPKILPYDAYHKAGGILNGVDYAVVTEAGTGAMNGEAKELLAVHMKQAEVLAYNAGLQPDQVKPAVTYYAVLRKEATIDQWAESNSDQEVFAQAILITQGKEAYRDYISKYPHIFKTQG